VTDVLDSKSSMERLPPPANFRILRDAWHEILREFCQLLGNAGVFRPQSPLAEVLLSGDFPGSTGTAAAGINALGVS
jgi:hypothetical protein